MGAHDKRPLLEMTDDKQHTFSIGSVVLREAKERSKPKRVVPGESRKYR